MGPEMWKWAEASSSFLAQGTEVPLPCWQVVIDGMAGAALMWDPSAASLNK